MSGGGGDAAHVKEKNVRVCKKKATGDADSFVYN
jgi:hypothetical protein